MAVQGSLTIERTLLAGADLSAESNLYKLVKLSTGKVILTTGTTDIPFGVLITLGVEDAAVTVLRLGRTKINANEALSVGDKIGTSADGQAAPYVFGTDTTKYIIGDVIVAAGAAGDYATADVNCINAPRGA